MINNEQKIYSYIGLAMRAGKVVSGDDTTLKELKKGKLSLAVYGNVENDINVSHISNVTVNVEEKLKENEVVILYVKVTVSGGAKTYEWSYKAADAGEQGAA